MDVKDLALRGWTTIQFNNTEESALRKDLILLSQKLGKPVPVRTGDNAITALTPAPGRQAHPNSLSSRFSCGEFELHTDTAHWAIPCRYILLACVDSGGGGRPTLLLDTKRLPLSTVQFELLNTAPVRITNSRNSFYSTILSRGRDFVRFDAGCMTAPTITGSMALEVLRRKNWPAQVERFFWRPGLGLVIDNWRILHGRGLAATEDPRRKLLRVSIL